jgi:hypothetical protein
MSPYTSVEATTSSVPPPDADADASSEGAPDPEAQPARGTARSETASRAVRGRRFMDPTIRY